MNILFLNGRSTLNAMLQAEKNRLRTHSGSIRHSLEQVIACLKIQLKEIEKEIRSLLQQHTDLHAQEKLLRTAKSIGPVTAATLLADLPEHRPEPVRLRDGARKAVEDESLGGIGLLAWLARRSGTGSLGLALPWLGTASQPSPREILQARYARGEITREEYEQIRRDLRD